MGRLWGHPVTSSMTSSSWKYFFSIIWDDLFISEVQLKLCLIFQNFQNVHYFEVATNFYTVSLFNVNKKYKECDISDYMKNNGVSVLKIKEISRKEATNKSFRVIMKAADYEKAMSSQFWVEGIKCREWVRWIDVNTCSCIVCCSILCVSSHH